MKKALRTIMIGMLALFMLTGSAWAITITFQDNYVNWPGYTPGYTADTIGAPRVGDMTVYIEAGYLDKIEIQVQSRIFWDALFINTTGGTISDYEKWNYYVHSESAGSSQLYTVNDPNTVAAHYILAPDWGGTGR